MSALAEKFSKYFVGEPRQRFTCPTCKSGLLVPDVSSFFEFEPTFSKDAYDHEAWDVYWVERRFSFRCVCNNEGCGEVALVAGSGGTEQVYDQDGDSEYSDYRKINSFFPAPDIVPVPAQTPSEVSSRLRKSFLLYWVDTSAAANAVRASLEALLDELKIPSTQKTRKGNVTHLTLHRRLEFWSEGHEEYAQLCIVLKEVGNLGSHGETVSEKHYFGTLEIYSHVLHQLFENNAARMKELAAKIQSELKGRK